MKKFIAPALAGAMLLATPVFAYAQDAAPAAAPMDSAPLPAGGAALDAAPVLASGTLLAVGAAAAAIAIIAVLASGGNGSTSTTGTSSN